MNECKSCKSVKSCVHSIVLNYIYFLYSCLESLEINKY